MFLTFSEVKGVSSIVLLFLTFWKVKRGKGGVSTVGDPKSSRKSSKQQEKQQTTGTAQAEASCTKQQRAPKAATQEKSTKRISKSSTNMKKQQHKQ